MRAQSPTVTVYPDERALAVALADRIAARLSATPDLVLALPTGRTPVLFYGELASRAAAGRADFSRATTFNLDEFLGLPADHPGSFRTFMQTHLFSRVNLAPARTHFLDGVAPDPEAECARYERAIADAGGIDVLMLGIGTNGHIGFNEPGPTLHARTHRVTLTPETRRGNAQLFGGDADAVPAEALSMGMATILRARSIVLLATGGSKATTLQHVVDGPITTDLPASFLQLHPDVEILVDVLAGAQLRGGTVAGR